MARKTKYDDAMQQVSLRLPQALLARVDRRAKRLNAPRAEVIVTALKKGLGKDPVEPAPGSVFE